MHVRYNKNRSDLDTTRPSRMKDDDMNQKDYCHQKRTFEENKLMSLLLQLRINNLVHAGNQVN